MENNAQHTNPLIIVNNNKDVIPTTNGFSTRLTNLSDKITREKQSFTKQLNELSKDKNVDIGRNWWGTTDLESIRKAFSCVYADCRNYATQCGDAILSVSDNMSNILELIQLLATVEVDIYHMVDNQSIANNELRELIKEWCKEHGIKDEAIEKLLTSSVQRAYTLRDRIENLRKDCSQKIGQNTEEIQQLRKEQIENLKEIEKKNEDSIAKGQQYIERLEKEVQKKSEGFQKEQTEKLLEMKQALDASAEEIKKASTALKERQDAFITRSQQETTSALKDLDAKQKENYEALRKEQTEKLLEMKQALDASAEEIKKASTALKERQDAFITRSQQETASALKDLDAKQKENYEALRKEQSEKLLEMKQALETNVGEMKKASTALQEKQDVFITKSQKETASALEALEMKQNEDVEALRKNYENKLSEMKRQYAEETNKINELIKQNTQKEQTFINTQTTLMATLKKQITIYKIISVCAIGVSIATIIYTILT